MMHGLLIPNHAQKIWIPMNEIIVLRSVRNYTEVILQNGKKFLFSRTLKIVAERIAANQQFFRINRGSFVNLKQVVSYEQAAEGLTVYLSNGECEIVSRRRQVGFYNAFENSKS